MASSVVQSLGANAAARSFISGAAGAPFDLPPPWPALRVDSNSDATATSSRLPAIEAAFALVSRRVHAPPKAWFQPTADADRKPKAGAVTYLIVGLDRTSLAPWHVNIRADDVATAKRIALARAAASGIALVLAAAIGPNSSVVPDVADQPATRSKAA
jgi:hypothetical protein